MPDAVVLDSSEILLKEILMLSLDKINLPVGCFREKAFWFCFYLGSGKETLEESTL